MKKILKYIFVLITIFLVTGCARNNGDLLEAADKLVNATNYSFEYDLSDSSVNLTIKYIIANDLVKEAMIKDNAVDENSSEYMVLKDNKKYSLKYEEENWVQSEGIEMSLKDFNDNYSPASQILANTNEDLFEVILNNINEFKPGTDLYKIDSLDLTYSADKLLKSDNYVSKYGEDAIKKIDGSDVLLTDIIVYLKDGNINKITFNKVSFTYYIKKLTDESVGKDEYIKSYEYRISDIGSSKVELPIQISAEDVKEIEN